MRLALAEHGFHALGRELLLVELAHEHEVGDVGDDVEWVGDAAFPHLLPDGVDLVLG